MSEQVKLFEFWKQKPVDDDELYEVELSVDMRKFVASGQKYRKAANRTNSSEYRVIHKFVKNFKNLQQINYIMDTKFFYTELISPSFFLPISQLLSVFGYATDIYMIIHFILHMSTYHS